MKTRTCATVGVTSSLAVVGFLAGGCASTARVSDQPASPTSEKKVLTAAQYDLVYVTGSLVPVRVPKDKITRPLPGAEPLTVLSPEQFDTIVQRNLGSGHP